MITPDVLAALPLFADLSAERRAHVAEHGADIALAKGDYVLHEGESPVLFVVIEGSLEITKRAGNIERVLGVRCPGETFGEVRSCSGRRRSRTRAPPSARA
jgi:CRP-like cAMP-binding protein